MGKPKLTYFDFVGSRGEECRLALAIAGVDFEDDRITREEWAELKPNTPYQKVPVLSIEGKPPIGECNAILGVVGRKHDLLPVDDFEAARHLALLSAGEAFRNDVTKTFGIDDEDELKKKRAEFTEGPLAAWGRNMEAQIEGPWVGGDKISVADIKICIIAGWIKKGVLDHVPADALDGFPKLSKVVEGVKNHPAVVAFYGK